MKKGFQEKNKNKTYKKVFSVLGQKPTQIFALKVAERNNRSFLSVS